MRLGMALLGAALLLAGCGDQATLEGWCQKRMQPKADRNATAVNCDCFASTVIGAPDQSQDRKDTYKTLMSVAPLYAAGNDDEADRRLKDKGIGMQISVAAMITGAALRCAVAK